MNLQSKPRLAIVIPIFRHASLVTEAIESALAQTADFGIRIILVNDGCPFSETHEVCRDYALAFPDRITYLRKSNGGLSDARNHGIRHVLATWPSVEAIYMLDADNQLRDGAMRRAMAELDAHPDAAWIYPAIDMMGLRWGGDYGGEYSTLIHSAMNICEAGSLIRREIFERGVFFDTDFKLGWEDWDFFVTANEHGFRGRNLEGLGFRYRKRPESMLANSERSEASIAAAMKLKHKEHWTPRALVNAEQREAPRYAIHLGDDEILYCVDPAAPGSFRVSHDEFDRDYWLSRINPSRHRAPPFNIVMDKRTFAALERIGLVHWALWAVETALVEGHIVALKITTNASGRIGLIRHEEGGATGAHREADILAIAPGILKDVLDDSTSTWIDSLASDPCLPLVQLIELNLPVEHWPDHADGKKYMTAKFLAIIHQMRSSPRRDIARMDWEHRTPGIPMRGAEYQIPRTSAGGAPVFPRVEDGRKHVGFLLPLVEFGGVEKVALHIARAMRARGWIPHAIILEARDAALTPEWQQIFESTSFFLDPTFTTWGGGGQDYLGTNVPHWAQHGSHSAAIGMLHWLDVAFNFHGGAIIGMLGQLKRMGVTILDSLHLNDVTPYGRTVGNAYLGLGYEHAIDLFTPCSQQLGDWLHGMGVPRDKILPIPNAPGFELDAMVAARCRQERDARPADAPLRVLFLGRLDRQKGLDRLAEVMRQSQAEGLDIEWRVLGKDVVAEDGATALPAEVAEILEPPVSDPADLTTAYGSADVMVLLSRYEGLPLTILEAMRQGVVVLAADVGAVSEVVHDGDNAVLLPAGNPVPACLAALRHLVQDRAELQRLSRRAQADMADRDWVGAVAPLVARLSLLRGQLHKGKKMRGDPHASY